MPNQCKGRSHRRAAAGLAILMLGLSACSPSGQFASPAPNGANGPDLSASPASLGPTAELTVARTAEIAEIQNDVSSRAELDDNFESAIVGDRIQVGGGVRTGDESRVRIDTSDGSIVRIASHTEFQLLDFSPQLNDPITKIGLAEGRLWVWVTQALGLGTLEIVTPSGVATVRGSLMNVEYDSASGQMIVTCLEGACRLTAIGGQSTDLKANEFSEIPADRQPPTPPAPLTEQHLADWLANFPEAANVLADLAALSPANPTLSSTATASASSPSGSPAGSVDCTLRSVAAAEPTSVRFVNGSNRTVQVHWLSYDGQEVLYRTLEPGQSYTQPTFATHPWCVRDATSGEAVLAITATSAAQTAVVP